MKLILKDKDGKDKPVSFSGPPDSPTEIKEYIEKMFPGYTLETIDGKAVEPAKG